MLAEGSGFSLLRMSWHEGVATVRIACPAPWAVEYVLSQAPRFDGGAISDRVADATGPKIAVAEPCTKRSKTRASNVETAR